MASIKHINYILFSDHSEIEIFVNILEIIETHVVEIFAITKISKTVGVIGYNTITGHNYQWPIFQLKHHKDTQNMIKFERYYALRLSN